MDNTYQDYQEYAGYPDAYYPLGDQPCVLREQSYIAGNCSVFANDGECDADCNYAECGWDGDDCFHDDDGCYTEPDGNDYRGTVNVNLANKTCLYWTDSILKTLYKVTWDMAYKFTTMSYPDAGLGAHNFCRNPDHGRSTSPLTGCDGADCKHPWCLHSEWPGDKLGWAYCDVGKPRQSCPGKPDYFAYKSTKLELDQSKMVEGSVREHKYAYYHVSVPAELEGLQVVLIPLSGTPQLFADFDVPNPTAHNASYAQAPGGVGELLLTRRTYQFCGKTAVLAGSGDKVACELHLSVLGIEAASYKLAVFDTKGTSGIFCAEGCDWSSLGDGTCNPLCNTDACFRDRGDCDGNSSKCRADCSPDWIGDGVCDAAACFNYKCAWDGQDCGGEGCADKCLPRMINDGTCDAPCNVRSCDYDGVDCYHDHHECYRRPNGYDYRGTVSHTISGKQCQAWSASKPHEHKRTARNYPTAGVGGHNFCRNPDQSEESPWCYTTDKYTRYERCDVGEPKETCPKAPSPWAQSERLRHWPHAPPRPSPLPASPPPAPCPKECAALASDGTCDSLCNSTVCLWDKGDCGDLLEHMLQALDFLSVNSTVPDHTRLERLKMLLSTDLRTQTLALGVTLGMMGGIVAMCVCLFIKRKRRLASLHAHGSRHYTPYGESGGATESATEMAAK